ncbi:hypothetical protein C0J52_19333, partial [Blattella germanica]
FGHSAITWFICTSLFEGGESHHLPFFFGVLWSCQQQKVIVFRFYVNLGSKMADTLGAQFLVMNNMQTTLDHMLKKKERKMEVMTSKMMKMAIMHLMADVNVSPKSNAWKDKMVGKMKGLRKKMMKTINWEADNRKVQIDVTEAKMVVCVIMRVIKLLELPIEENKKQVLTRRMKKLECLLQMKMKDLQLKVCKLQNKAF